ncbi:MAG: S8 family serine peptidase [Myxococcota bacterium]
MASTLALPLVEGADGATVRDEENGGFFGSILDLALAIEDAVVAWRQDASDRPLVINMSLGWPSIHGGAYQHVEELPAPVRAVWDAIAKARCYGAAVVASTGNRTEGPSAGQGPLYPAGWASKTAPSVDTCHALGVEEVAEGYDESGPLVFAVGGLEANDADLGLGRQQARPRWVAPAAHAVVADGDEHSALQTGTSVASAVTAAAAAIVWSYRPELSADEVFDVVYEGGADIGRPVELCVGGCEAQTARRVSICGAVMQACSGQEGVCPAELPACERMPGGREVRPDPQALVPAAQRVVSASMVQHQASVGWPCFGDVYASSEDVANPCPAAQFFGAATLGAVGPQPRGTPICPHCVYSGASQQLEIIIDDNTAGTVTNPVLAVVVDSSSSDVRYFDLSDEVPPMTGGERTTVTDLDLGTPTYESATIEFLIDGATAERSPVLTW